MPIQQQYNDNGPTLKSEIITNTAINAPLTSAIAVSDAIKNKKLSALSKAEKTREIFKNIKSGLAAGALTAVPGAIANHYGMEASKALSKHYIKEDEKVHPGHLAMIYAPAAAASTYLMGASLRGVEEHKKLFNKKQPLKNRVKDLLDPKKTWKRGWTENVNSLKALNPLKKMPLKGRIFGALNLVGLLAAAKPAYDYFKNVRKKDGDVNRNRLVETVGPYVDDVARASLITKAAAIELPVLSSLGQWTKHRAIASRAKSILGESSFVKSQQKQAKKHLENALIQAGGLTAVGYIGKKSYEKYKAEKEKPVMYL